MRCFYKLTLILGMGYLPTKAQSILHFTVRQPLPLTVDAGTDRAIQQGEKATLGGISTASGGTGSYTYAWTPTAGLNRPDVAHPEAAPATTTRYHLVVGDSNGCSQEAYVMVTVNTVTATYASKDLLGLRLFPNPTQDQFSLISEQWIPLEPLVLEIYNPLGQRVYTEIIKSTGQKLAKRVQFPSSTRGLYLVRLTGYNVNALFKLLVQ